MIYQVRIKNSVFGYFSDEVEDIEASSETEALAIAQQRDQFADCTVVGTAQWSGPSHGKVVR